MFLIIQLKVAQMFLGYTSSRPVQVVLSDVPKPVGLFVFQDDFKHQGLNAG